MSNVLKSVVTGWIHSSPATKKPVNGENEDTEMQRGVKRKAKVDPYDQIDDDDEGRSCSLRWGFLLILNAPWLELR